MSLSNRILVMFYLSKTCDTLFSAHLIDIRLELIMLYKSVFL